MIFQEWLLRAKEKVHLGFKHFFKENLSGMHGEIWVTLKDAPTGVILQEYHFRNIIVNSASILIARLLKDNHEPDTGISYLAVGTGGAGWDKQDPPAPVNTQTTLENELARKAFTTEDVSFVDPTTGDHTEVPTNVVDFEATFAETEAVGALLEMGLFGGDATDMPDSGTQINYRTFPVINKSASMSMSIIIRITA